MVRLEGPLNNHASGKQCRFNSIMVRLEVSGIGYCKGKSVVSIPLWFDWKLDDLTSASFPALSFNSIMVRLEDPWQSVLLYLLKVSIPLWFDWKRGLLRHGNVILNSFNSIMVRLEAACSCRFCRLRQMFQFHYGSIGRGYPILNNDEMIVSIPLWFDWKFIQKAER